MLFSTVPIALDDRYRRLRLLVAGVRNSMSRPVVTWVCGCGQAQRYEPIRMGSATTLTITCPGCCQTKNLRVEGRRAIPDPLGAFKVGRRGRQSHSRALSSDNVAVS